MQLIVDYTLKSSDLKFPDLQISLTFYQQLFTKRRGFRSANLKKYNAMEVFPLNVLRIIKIDIRKTKETKNI